VGAKGEQEPVDKTHSPDPVHPLEVNGTLLDFGVNFAEVFVGFLKFLFGRFFRKRPHLDGNFARGWLIWLEIWPKRIFFFRSRFALANYFFENCFSAPFRKVFDAEKTNFELSFLFSLRSPVDHYLATTAQLFLRARDLS
jgi:hypothetical protein